MYSYLKRLYPYIHVLCMYGYSYIIRTKYYCTRISTVQVNKKVLIIQCWWDLPRRRRGSAPALPLECICCESHRCRAQSAPTLALCSKYNRRKWFENDNLSKFVGGICNRTSRIRRVQYRNWMGALISRLLAFDWSRLSIRSKSSTGLPCEADRRSRMRSSSSFSSCFIFAPCKISWFFASSKSGRSSATTRPSSCSWRPLGLSVKFVSATFIESSGA